MKYSDTFAFPLYGSTAVIFTWVCFEACLPLICTRCALVQLRIFPHAFCLTSWLVSFYLSRPRSLSVWTRGPPTPQVTAVCYVAASARTPWTWEDRRMERPNRPNLPAPFSCLCMSAPTASEPWRRTTASPPSTNLCWYVPLASNTGVFLLCLRSLELNK